MSQMGMFYYQQKLQEELIQRIDRNPRYSIRSFAIALGLDSSTLSKVLAGKRSISTKLVDRILKYLELDEAEQTKFVKSIIEEKKQNGLTRISPKLLEHLKRPNHSHAPNKLYGIDSGKFRVIADWFHYAILELTFSKNFQNDPRWIAKELGISPVEAKLAISRLIEFKLLENKNGQLRKTNWNIDLKDKSKTSLFHRKRQKQILEKSIYSLEHDPLEDRNHSSITACIDPKNISAAKSEIQNFLWKLVPALTEGNPERVYELSVNLFPLQIKPTSSPKKLETRKL